MPAMFGKWVESSAGLFNVPKLQGRRHQTDIEYTTGAGAKPVTQEFRALSGSLQLAIAETSSASEPE